LYLDDTGSNKLPLIDKSPFASLEIVIELGSCLKGYYHHHKTMNSIII
jgi:hypothetical protein